MTTTRRTILLAASTLGLVLGVTACTAADPAPAVPSAATTSTTPTTAQGSGSARGDLDALAALGAQELVATLEATPVAERRTDLGASVRPDEVLLSSDGAEVAVPVPDGQHYLSIAPYVTSRHDCFFHSLTTCTGELGGEDVTVRIVDDETGKVYVDESGPLQDNGFIGFWLPADRTATVTVESADGEGSATVSTGDEDLTCLTDLQLT